VVSARNGRPCVLRLMVFIASSFMPAGRDVRPVWSGGRRRATAARARIATAAVADAGGKSRGNSPSGLKHSGRLESRPSKMCGLPCSLPVPATGSQTSLRRLRGTAQSGSPPASLLLGAAGDLKDGLDRDARAPDDGLAHHDVEVTLDFTERRSPCTTPAACGRSRRREASQHSGRS